VTNQRSTPGARLKILLVEDSLGILRILTELIETVPTLELVAVADTAVSALHAFRLHRPDVVILDLALREGHGLEVLREIKQHAPGCRVLIFTAHDAEPYRSRCLTAGADLFFSKHREHRELVRHLRQLGELPLPPAEAGAMRPRTVRTAENARPPNLEPSSVKSSLAGQTNQN
jgi:DNA-binding NarL/FixJ family response regulator